MKLIVCGAGQVGSQIARQLSNEGNSVTVIDVNPSLVRQLTDSLDVSGVVGFASHPDVLADAGAPDAEMLIAATSLDEVNMMACLIGHAIFDVPVRIARLRAESYLEPEWSALFRREHLPIDVIISPETEIANVTMRRLAATAAFDIEPFFDGKADFVGLTVPPDSPIINTPLRQLTELFSTLRAIVVGIRREGVLWTARPEDQIFPEDEIYLVAAHEDVHRAFDIFGRKSLVAERVVLAGAGNIGLRVARKIEERGILRAKLIERDRARAEFAADHLEHTIILHGDILNAEILEEAGVPEADALVALTDDDRVNLLACGLADEAGCPIGIALANDPIYERIAERLGVTALIDPRATTVSSILRHVRRGKVRAVYSVGDGEAEVIEAQILPTSPIAGKRVREIDFPKNAIIGAVLGPDREVHMPRGDLVARVGDSMVVFAMRPAVRQVEQMFRVSMDFF